MSTAMATPEDFKFFDYLAPYRWPGISKKELQSYRKLVEHGDLQIETVLENALALASDGLMTRVAEVGYDFYPCRSDAKKAVSCFRNNSKVKKHWSNTITISGLKNKIGLIRALCYSKAEDKFYCFAIPYSAYKGRNMVEVLLDHSTGYAEPNGIPKGKWTAFIVEDFKRLATITEAEALLLMQKQVFKKKQLTKRISPV